MLCYFVTLKKYDYMSKRYDYMSYVKHAHKKCNSIV